MCKPATNIFHKKGSFLQSRRRDIINLALLTCFITSNVYCASFTISFFDLSGLPITSLAKAPLISSWRISSAVQESIHPNGFPGASYTVEYRRPPHDTTQHPQQPRQQGKIHSQNLKQPHEGRRSDRPDSATGQSPKDKKGKKKKGKTGKKGASKSEKSKGDADISFPEAPTCPLQLAHPLRLFEYHPSSTHQRTIKFEQDINQPDTYYLSFDQFSSFSLPPRTEKTFKLPPNALIEKWLEWEKFYGRFGTPFQDGYLRFSSPLITIVSAMHPFPSLWANSLFDIVLGVDCRFSVNAVLHIDSNNAVLLGMQFMLNNPDGSSLNIFAQITPNDLTSTQTDYVEQQYTPNGWVSAYAATQHLSGINIPGAAATGSSSPQTVGVSPQLPAPLLTGSPFEVINLPGTPHGMSHPITIPTHGTENPVQHSAHDSGVVASAGQSVPHGSITPYLPLASFQGSTGSQSYSLEVFSDLESPALEPSQELTHQPLSSRSGGLLTSQPTGSAQNTASNSRSRAATQGEQRLPPATDEYITIELSADRPHTTGKRPPPRFRIATSSGGRERENYYDPVAPDPIQQEHRATEPSRDNYSQVRLKTPATASGEMVPPRPPHVLPPILPPRKSAPQETWDKYRRDVATREKQINEDEARYDLGIEQYQRWLSQKPNDTESGDPPKTCHDCLPKWFNPDDDDDDPGSGSKGTGRMLLNLLPDSSSI